MPDLPIDGDATMLNAGVGNGVQSDGLHPFGRFPYLALNKNPPLNVSP
jgi:hypothetical protein